jgi:hypothetical protein
VTLGQKYIFWWWWRWIILPIIEKYYPGSVANSMEGPASLTFKTGDQATMPRIRWINWT